MNVIIKLRFKTITIFDAEWTEIRSGMYEVLTNTKTYIYPINRILWIREEHL